jgi:hypothetical protein
MDGRIMPRGCEIKLRRADFVAMWEDDHITTKEIADRFGISCRQIVSRIAGRMGLPPRQQGARPTRKKEE